MKSDAISIVEAAYDWEGDHGGWLERLVMIVAPRLDRGLGIAASMYEPGIAPERMQTACRFKDEKLQSAFVTMAQEYPDQFHRANLQRAPVSTVTKTLGISAQRAPSWRPFVAHMHPFGVQDVTAIIARDPTGCSIGFTVPMPDLRRPTRADVAIWSRITAHISAGARLRRLFPGARSSDLSEGAAAVLSPSGTIAHAEVEAQSPGARESLRRAARAIDRARSKARANEDEALELWQGLVAGRWSLFDRFDSDGRRFLVARKNDPDITDPRALTLRERQVLAYAAMGDSLKLIGYSLGLSMSSVSESRRTAMRKLGLRTHADVVRLFAQGPTP